MIEPKVMEFSEGEYVLHSDYARLKAEVERLTSENKSLQAKATNIYNAMVVGCKVEEITHKANADSIISQGMMSEAMKMMEESVAIREQIERLTKAGDAMASGLQGMAGERPKALADEWNDAKGVQS
jgi:hypothetical protein